MRSPEDASLLADLLDRQVEYLLKHKDARLLLGLAAFIEFLETEPRLAGVVDDMQGESEAAWNEYANASIEVLDETHRLWDATKTVLETVRQADTNDACHWAELGFDGFDSKLEKARNIERDVGDNPESVSRVRFLLSHWVKCGVQSTAVVGSDREVLEAANAKLVALEESLDEASAIYRVKMGRHGGFALSKLRSGAERLIPRSTTGEDGLMVAAKNMGVKNLWQNIEGNAALWDVGGFELDVSELVSAVEQVQLDLQTRLGRGRTRVAVVRRYAARCETFDRPRLLELIKQAKPRKVEEDLTIDFARYLFDVGFNPIVSPQIAGLRPDLFDPSLRPGIYVEAKQYTSITKAALAKYVSQVFDTWGRLRKTYDLPEAFLLVFRRGGRLAELPEIVKSHGRTLRLELVDLAPARTTGSRASQSPLQVEESDLLPSGGK